MKFNSNVYWSEAVRNWGSGVHRSHWTRRDADMDWRLKMETFRAAARYI